MNIAELAQKNIEERFVDNPCRGIVAGVNDLGHPVQLSWIMGRSDGSKNRVYVVEGSTVKTEPADPSKVKNKEDLKLIIYNAMKNQSAKMIVSNGDQTDTIQHYFVEQGSNISHRLCFYEALRTRHCEPDPTIFTPRITGHQDMALGDTIYMSILKAEPNARERWISTVEASELKPEQFENKEEYNFAIGKLCGLDHNTFPTVSQFFEFPAVPGIGYCLTTYRSGSKELPSFEGEPFAVPLLYRVEDSMAMFWDKLEPEWRVALAGKTFRENETYIPPPINKFPKVESE